ncbi:MAG: beta-lactamase family protein [Chloroflexi bacterium]|nr:beta-lactamase family protein [Chloroflexota bacterium]
MKKTLLVLLIISMLLVACGTPSLEVAPETERENNSQNDENQFGDYADFVEEIMEDENIPGVAVAIVEGSEIAFTQGFGWQDIENELPVTPETLFHIGSTNKSMTAMMIATLVDDGLFDWDTPVVEIYPDFELSDAEAIETVTMRHFLSMQSGIPDDAEDSFDVDNAEAEDVFDFLTNTPLFAMPGEEFSYSNISASMAGYLGVLANDGEYDDLYDGYARLLKEKVLDPIGMKTATIRVSELENNPNYGKSYILNDDGFPIEAEPEDFDGDPLAPSGTLKANVHEMALYLSTQLNYGVAPNGRRIVSEKNLTETWKADLENYGMGWEVIEYQGVELISHEGSYDNYLSVIGFIPELDTGFVILTNSEEAAEKLIEESPAFLIDLFLENQ